MFDGAHARAYSAFDPGGAVRMCRHKFAPRLGGRNHCAQLIFGQFRFAGFGTNGKHRTRGDGFDEISALVYQERGFRGGFVGCACNTQAHVGRKLLVGNDAVEFTAALWDRNICASDKHARAGNIAGINGIAQCDIG